MTRKKAIVLAIGAIGIAAAVRHCMKAMGPSGACGEAVDRCGRSLTCACGSAEAADEASSETAALAA